MRHHTFKNVDTTGARFLKCIECESAPATRKCEQCEDVFCKDCYRVVHTNGQLAMHKYTEFKPGSQICVECDADFATIDCKECGDLFCESCSKKIHAKGEMAGHSLKPLDIWVRVVRVRNISFLVQLLIISLVSPTLLHLYPPRNNTTREYSSHQHSNTNARTQVRAILGDDEE